MNLDDLTPEDLKALAEQLAPYLEREHQKRIRTGMIGSGWTSPVISTIPGPVHYS